ncbi:hypothetical protein KCU73_g3114, partial [Aureobasidium melanogenum]
MSSHDSSDIGMQRIIQELENLQLSGAMKGYFLQLLKHMDNRDKEWAKIVKMWETYESGSSGPNKAMIEIMRNVQDIFMKDDDFLKHLYKDHSFIRLSFDNLLPIHSQATSAPRVKMAQSDVTDSENALARFEDAPVTREQMAYKKGLQDRQMNTAMKRYESGAPDERAMREIARKVDNVYNLDSNFLKYLLGILEEEMMAEGTETNDMTGLSSLPALPGFQQPRGNKTSLIGLKKGKKAGPKRRRMEDEDSDEDLNEDSMNHRVATTQQAIDALIKAAVEKAIIESEIKHLTDTIQTNESLIETLQERRRDTLNQADAVGNKWKASDAEEVITRKIDKLDSTIVSALGIVANMNNTIDMSLQFLQKQTAAASTRVQELESKLHACWTFVASWTKPQSLPHKLEKNLGTAKGYLEHTKKTLEKVSKKMESIVTGLEKKINDSVQSSINLIKAQIEQRKVDMEKANECKKRQFENYQLYHKAVKSMEEPKSGEIDQRVGAIYCDGHDWLTERLARWEEENKK